MAGDLPDWLLRQTSADFNALGKALVGVESDLGNITSWRVAANICTIRRALRYLGQDLRYVREFNDGAVLRRDGRAR